MNTDKFIIIGSEALMNFNVDLKRLRGKSKKDIDIDLVIKLSTKNEDCINVEDRKVDAHFLPDHIFDMIEHQNGYATPSMILTFKMSHLAWDIHWEKTQGDILELMEMGYSYDKKLYSKLKKHWVSVHGNKDFLSLKMDKGEFFNDFVEYVYDHDYLHELVAFPNKPMYTHCLQDGEDVMIDRNKFQAMSHENQIEMFAEEVTVIAIERWLIHNKKISWFKAYQFALKKTITNLTKNWANDFMIENLPELSIPMYRRFSHALDVLSLKYTADITEIESAYYWCRSKFNSNISLDAFIALLCIPYEEWDLIYASQYQDAVHRLPDKNDMKWFIKGFNLNILEVKKGCTGSTGYTRVFFSFNDEKYSAEFSYTPKTKYNIEGIQYTVRNVKEVTKIVTIYE